MDEIHKQIIVKVQKEVVDFGNSKGVIFPAEIVERLGLVKGTELSVTLESGKHGLYIAIFKPTQE